MSNVSCTLKGLIALSIFLLSANAFATTSTQTSTATATQTNLPWALLTINGRHSSTVEVNDPIVIRWNSTNAVSSSSYFSREDSAEIPWEINSSSGERHLTALLENAGHTYSITFIVRNSSGITTFDQASYTVNKPPKIVDPTNLSNSSSGGVVKFFSAVSGTNDSVVNDIDKKAAGTDGNQAGAIETAAQVKETAGNQAATTGAVLCAQGANAQLTNPSEAAELLAACQRSFDAAHAMNRTSFSPVNGTLADPASQQALADFEKNFGVSAEDYLSKMLGKGGGPGGLGDMVNGKISDAALAAAFEAANKLGEGVVLSDPNNSSSVSGLKRTSVALKESIKKNIALSPTMIERKPASFLPSWKKDIKEPPGKFRNLTPSNELSFSAKEEETPELTLFDVVHAKYNALQQRLWDD